MGEQLERSIRLSPAMVERAQRMVDATAKTPRLQLSLFAVGAGLMAGMLVKRARLLRARKN